jgi:hypothetical protein
MERRSNVWRRSKAESDTYIHANKAAGSYYTVRGLCDCLVARKYAHQASSIVIWH